MSTETKPADNGWSACFPRKRTHRSPSIPGNSPAVRTSRARK